MHRLSALLFCAALFAQQRPEWDDPSVIQVNAEKPHATMMVYPSAELARAGRPRQLPLVQAAQRKLEIPRLPEPRRPPARLLPPRLRRRELAVHPRALQLADARLRHPHLHQHHLSLAAGRHESRPPSRTTTTPSAATARTFTVPAGWKRPPGAPALRRRRFGLLRLGQRPEGRLQRRQPHARRVRHHALPQARREPARRRGLPLQRRRLPRRPGHVAHERHLPRRLPLEHRRRPRARLRSPHRPRRRLPRRDALRESRSRRPPARSRSNCSTPPANPPCRRRRRRRLGVHANSPCP